MANTKSAIKRIRRISRQTVVNKTRKSKFKNAIKKMNSLLVSKKKKEALAFLPKLNSELMKVAKTRIIKKQNVSRNISRITRKIKYFSKLVLNRAIKKGGSSIRDFKNIKGKKGNYQNEFKVYQRENLNCLKKDCYGKIKKKFISKRSTFFCNSCQK